MVEPAARITDAGQPARRVRDRERRRSRGWQLDRSRTCRSGARERRRPAVFRTTRWQWPRRCAGRHSAPPRRRRLQPLHHPRGRALPISAIRGSTAARVTGMIPGSTGLSTPRTDRSSTSPRYSSASKKNWVTAKSASLIFSARKSRSALPAMGRRGGRPDGPPPRWRSRRWPWPGPPAHRRGGAHRVPPSDRRGIPAQGHQVLHAGLAEVHQDLGQLEPGMGHADQMGHRCSRCGVPHPRHQVVGPVRDDGPPR